MRGKGAVCSAVANVRGANGNASSAVAPSLETAMADQRKREGAVFMTVAMLPLAPTEAKKSCRVAV